MWAGYLNQDLLCPTGQLVGDSILSLLIERLTVDSEGIETELIKATNIKLCAEGQIVLN